MRIAVIGGTGLVGRHTVDAVRRAGHSAVVVSRSHGVDVSTGEGLDAALTGVESMIDVTNVHPGGVEETKKLFEMSTKHLLAAGGRTGVLLSIVGLDGIEGNAHYAGKRVQEALVSSGPIPFTIQRATQFHEFA